MIPSVWSSFKTKTVFSSHLWANNCCWIILRSHPIVSWYGHVLIVSNEFACRLISTALCTMTISSIPWLNLKFIWEKCEFNAFALQLICIKNIELSLIRYVSYNCEGLFKCFRHLLNLNACFIPFDFPKVSQHCRENIMQSNCSNGKWKRIPNRRSAVVSQMVAIKCLLAIQRLLFNSFRFRVEEKYLCELRF